MRTSEKSATIAAALYAVHRDLENPRKNEKARVKMKQGGTYEYEYLSLPALIDHAKSALKEAQVAVIQDVGGDPQVIAVTTTFLHLTGEWVEVGPLVMPAPGDPQQRGSAITYARRYALAAALNLAADEDDDGASATSNPRREESTVTRAGDGVTDVAGAEAYGEGSEAPATSSSQDAHPGEEHHLIHSPTVKGLWFCNVVRDGRKCDFVEERR